MSSYSNIRAMRALIIASLQSIFKSPSAIVFSIAFPLIFIIIFGFLGGGGRFSISVAMAPGSDTNNMMYTVLHKVPVLKWKSYADTNAIKNAFSEGDIAATIGIRPMPEGASKKFNIVLNVSSSQADKGPQLSSIISNVMLYMDPEIQKRMDAIADIELKQTEVREYKTIDFILPGQLGFSLLAAGVFGTAFVFFNLRQTLVLKRFFATPVKREVIVISEGIARLIFQMMGAIIIISLGHFAFGFTLVHGWVTFLEMLALSALALMVFMGFGFIVSSVAKSESTIPPFANLITMPQFLLAGTFFPIDNFPKWLQPVCNVLPLTYFNDAMRQIAFDGATLIDVKTDIGIMLAWGIGLYFVAGRIFKWE